MNPSAPLGFALSLALLTSPAVAQQSDNPFLKRFPASGELRFEIEDSLQNPFYRPPSSIVSYPVAFEAPTKADCLSLRDAGGKPVAFQLSHQRLDGDGGLRFARVHLAAEVPHTGKSEFVLFRSDEGQVGTRPLFAWQSEAALNLHAGAQIVTIPNLDSLPGEGAAVPEPLMALDLGDGPIGNSLLDPGKRKLESITTKRSAQGPLFTEYSVTYTFDKGGSYQATLRGTRGTPFVELSETITGLAPDDAVRVTLELQAFAARDGARRKLSPEHPQLTLDGPDGKAIAIFSRRDHEWTGGGAPIGISAPGDDRPIAIVWQIAAPQPGAAAQRHLGIALHDAKAALATIASHPPGHYPNSSDTFASWLYHYHQRLPLDATKDWRLQAADLKPQRLFNAYRIARGRSVGQYRELAATAAAAEGHPMAAEWLAQAATAPPQVHAPLAARDGRGAVTLGELHLDHTRTGAGDGSSSSRDLLAVGDAYQVFADKSSAPLRRISWDGATPETRLLVADADRLLTTVEGSLIHETKSLTSLAVMATDPIKVNGEDGAPGLSSVPSSTPLLVEAGSRRDKIFVPGADGRLQADGGGWAFDGELGLISSAPDAGVSLATFGSPDGDAVNRIATTGLTLETEGKGISASVGFGDAPKAGAEPEPFAVAGHYHADAKGKLRLRFGEPEPATIRPRSSLLAFWKFDEAEGRSVANTKDPEHPAQIVGGGAEPAREKGVGFGEVHSLILDGTAHLETFFDTPLPSANTVCVWVKTEKGGAVWTKAALSGGKLVPGSRALHIDAAGVPVATLIAAGGEIATLTADAKLGDKKWHHIVWSSKGDAHQLYIDGELATEKTSATPASPHAAMRIAAATKIPSATGESQMVANFTGTIDNLRVYNRPLRPEEIKGISIVGAGRAPIVITSEPQKLLRVGERFNYALEFTGAPFVQFRFIGLPDWLKFEGRITGIPTRKDLGLSKQITIAGICPWGPAQQTFQINVLPPLVAKEWKVYANGRPIPTRYSGYGIEADLPAGSGEWQFTNKRPVPATPEILRAVGSKEGTDVHLRPAAGAESYKVEVSSDGGESWTAAVEGKGSRLRIEKPALGKHLLRAIAQNADHQSAPSPPFEVHVTDAPPGKPAAPEISPNKGRVKIAWSEVAGATTYKLVRRERGAADGDWKPVYSGSATAFTDRAAKGAVPPYPLPGYQNNTDRDMSGVTVYEYALTAENDKGESERGDLADTDPRAWR